MAKQGENDDLMELGKRSRAGRVLSEYLRGIATERTETVIDPITCKAVIVSKAEALARKLWDRAMGRRIKEDPETGRTVIVEGEIDLDCAKLLLERIEGKTGVSSDATDAGKPTAADRVSEVNKRRLNSMAEGGDDDQ